ncbi:TetR/AcrR family transcriptional regulator [Paenibacillus sinopodophylli]|uniref:TetR/AcrR family transcriptional regulator n=1 Tax=Paenibacillus sinopodophylli TaxID=1837342 RepID=UPI00110CD8DC|nr:TetR/AcrR family transcriptional regulator [Paenibacillus sinopodophylli]
MLTITIKKDQRAEETKQSIIAAAEKLFRDKSFEDITIRQIAKEAGCSHTTIYIYFQDKESLLHTLSLQPMQLLQASLDKLSGDVFLAADEKLRRFNEQYIRFCLDNRSMYSIFFQARSTLVNEVEVEPELEVNKLRQQMFQMISQLLRTNLNLSDSEDLLSCSQIYFYMLHGIVGTYTQSEDNVDSIMKRLSPTFNAAFEALLLGFGKKMDDKNRSHKL